MNVNIYAQSFYIFQWLTVYTCQDFNDGLHNEIVIYYILIFDHVMFTETRIWLDDMEWLYVCP